MKTNPALRLAMLLLFLVAAGEARADNLLTTPGAAASAVAEIVAKIGHTPRVSLIDITPDAVVLHVQGEKEFHVDEWRWSLVGFWYVEHSLISGPNAVRSPSPVDDVAASFFPLAGVNLDKVPDVVAAAVKRAALEDEATADRARIERPVSIFPKAQYGEPRWIVSVDSGRESATVYAAPDGTIIGADLSGTQRARMLNLLVDDSRLPEAKADLAAVLADARVREVSVSKTDISVSTKHPSKQDYSARYRWNLNGVLHDPIGSPEFGSDSEVDVTFAFADLDFSVLPKLKQEALDKLKLKGGIITGLRAKKLVTGLRPPELIWIVEIEDANGERAQVTADTRGQVLEVVAPEGHGPPKPEWLAGSTIRATLDRLFDKFPKDAKFKSILSNDEQGHVEAEDPLKPGEMASFIVDHSRIEPWGTPFPDEVFGMGPPQLFTAEDMAGYDAATLDILKQRTLERLKVQGGVVSRLTFEKGNVFVASPRGQVLVEIRVEGPKRSGGRVTYEPDGTELDVVLP